jgi:hypothetical protein
MNPPADPGFQVSISGAVRELLVRLHEQAARAGDREGFLSALRTITERLQTDPVNFGEELFDLRALRLTVRVGIVLPVVVEFGVYLDRRVVFVRTFRYLPPG